MLTWFPSCRYNRLDLLGPMASKYINIRPGSCTKLHGLWASCFVALARFGSKKETLPLRDKWATSIQVRPHTSSTQQWNSQALHWRVFVFCLFQKHSSSYHLDEKHGIPYPIIWTHQHIAQIIDFISWFARMWFHVVSFEICHIYGLLLRDDNK